MISSGALSSLNFGGGGGVFCWQKISGFTATLIWRDSESHPGANWMRWKVERLPSLKLTYPLKIDPWKRRFLLETIIFRGYVSFRECKFVIWRKLRSWHDPLADFWLTFGASCQWGIHWTCIIYRYQVRNSCTKHCFFFSKIARKVS